MALRVLGSVVNITKSGLVITRIENYKQIPPINSQVFDANGEEIGRLVDIIGPVNSPYGVVRVKSFAVISTIKPSVVLFYRYREHKGKRTS